MQKTFEHFKIPGPYQGYADAEKDGAWSLFRREEASGYDALLDYEAAALEADIARENFAEYNLQTSEIERKYRTANLIGRDVPTPYVASIMLMLMLMLRN